jgi:hypothetical protein
VVRFSPALDLSESHARSRIFIRDHDISCSAHSPAVAKASPAGNAGVDLCKILDAIFKVAPAPEGG